MLEYLAGLQLAMERAFDQRPRHLAPERIGDLGHHGRIHFHLLQQRLPHLEQAVDARRSSDRVRMQISQLKSSAFYIKGLLNAWNPTMNFLIGEIIDF